MATRISPKNKTYYINPAYLTFNENSGYGANLIQVSASSSCWISVYDPSNGIGYSDADRNYKRWKVTAYNNKFPEGSDNKLFHIYVRLEAEGTAALIVYDTQKRGVKGGLITETTDENGNKVEKEDEVDEENLTYYYIRIGQVSEVKGSLREITYDTGYLTSDEASNDKSGIDEMFELDKYSTPWLIKAKQWLQGWMPGSSKGFIVKGFAKLIGGLAFSKGKDGDEKLITDVKRSTDSDEEFLLDAEGKPQLDEQGNYIPDPAYVPVSDETIPTTKYVDGKLEGFDKKYIRKDQDDSTPYALTVGGKTTASGGIQIGKEFMSGLTGYGANINEEGRAELHSLFIRQFLEVPELRYNRVTVRMGDSITSCAAGVVESVNILSENEGTFKLKLEKGELGSLAVDDIVVQIFSDMKNPENNADETSDDGKGNRTMKGFATVMLRVIDVSGERNEIITYRLRKGYPHPYAMGPFAQRGNFTNSERQTIIYEGVYPKPYTRYMTGVNDWEFSFAMIGMQLGDLSNLSVFGQSLSGYSAYLNNIYYTGFIIELTPQQKAEISAYSVSLSEYVGSVRVDSEGNVIAGEYMPLNVVSGDENVTTEGLNVVTGEVLLQTRVQAFKGEEELVYVSGIPEKGQFTSVISSSGCTAVISNGIVSITSVENFEYCFVKIETLCEGKTTFYNTYQVKVIKDGASALVVDLDNENDTIACKEDGSYLYGLPVSTHVMVSYGEKLMDIKSIELVLPQDEDGNDLLTAVADAGTGKVEVVSVSDKAPDVMQIAIYVTVELFGKDETRSVVFTVGKLKQGESSEIYRLKPSVSVIKRFNDGQLSTSVVSCSVTRYTGKSSEELVALPEGLAMSYKIDGVPAEYIYKEEIGIAKSNKEVVFTLYVDGVKRDEETILVVSDGNAVKEVKEWYLANDDKDTVPSYDDAWTLEIPSISKDAKYLWNYEETDYTDPSMEDVKTVPVVIAMWTQDGKGVKKVTEWYQVNNDKDSAPDYPHVDGDAWVSETAPVMTEEAKYLWNYEEILWTDDSVTYTEPAMIGAKGETGATTPVLSVSYKAVSRNSLGTFDPSTVVVSSKRGTEDNPVWMSAFGVYKVGGIEYHTFLGDSEGKVSVWNVELKKWSESVDELKITSIKFRSYSEQTNNYLQPWIAEDGLTFVQQGEVGEDGPMPRNRGQYDGDAEYFYNDEYRDYVWKPNGMVWIRQGRGVTRGTSTEGAVRGEEPSDTGNTEYWEVADRMALTAIDTALIDTANIAGFMFRKGKIVSQEQDPMNLVANIIIDGSTGKIKCNDAEVKGLITVDNIEYDVQYSSDGSLVQSAMVIGPGEFTLPLISEGYTTEIKAIYPTVESRAVRPPFKFGHSQNEASSILFYDSASRWWKFYSEVELEPNILYTFVSYNDNGTHRWMLTTSTGEGAPGNSPVVDSELNINSTNPVQNKVVTGEFVRIGPIVYDSSNKYWKLNGDLLVTGGVTSFVNEGKYTPSTITDGVKIDGQTIVRNPESGALMINPDIELGGGSKDSYTKEESDQKYLAKTSYTPTDVLAKLKDVDGAGSGLDADTIDGVDSSKLFVAQRETINRDNLDVFEWRDSGSVQVMRYTSSGAVIDASPLYTFRCNGSYQGFELYQEYNASGPVYKMRSIKDVGAFTPWKTIAFEESFSDTYLPLAGGKMSGHIYMGGAKETSSTSNPSQLIFGTSGNEHVAISSNSDAVIINPNSTSTEGQVILGVNGKASEFTGGEVKVGDILIKRNADGVLLIDGDVIVSGGVTSFVNEGKYTPSTITDGVNVDGQTIIKSGGKLMLNPDIELGGGIESITKQMVIEALGYAPYNSTNPSGYITGITKSMVITALGFTPYSSANPNGYITSSGSITGNAATATTASKLSVKTKKAWGRTYWTSEGVPTDIIGDMENVGNISVESHGTKSLGANKKGLLHVYTNYINSGHSDNNNLWLVGGRVNDDVGLIFARGLDSSDHKELGRWNGHGLKVNKAVLCNNYSNLNHIVELRGGKNLFVDGDGYRGGSGYRVGFYNYDSSVVKDRTYRITMCAKLGTPNTHILAFWAGGSGDAVWIDGLSNEEERVVSFVAKSSSLGSSGGMGFYNYPNKSPNGSYIRWVHMEEDCVESDFSTTAKYEEWLASQRTIRPTSFVSNVEQILFGDRTDAQHKSLSIQGDHLRLRGNLLVTGGITSYNTSDERLKENIRIFNAGETLMSLGGAYQFEYCESEVAENKRYEGTHIGLIYQKVKESALKGMCMEREDGYGALNYLDTDFISLLAAVGMEHERKVNGLEEKVERLERMVEQLMNK